MNNDYAYVPNQVVLRHIEDILSQILGKLPDRKGLKGIIKIHMQILRIGFHLNTENYPVLRQSPDDSVTSGLYYKEFKALMESVVKEYVMSA